MDRSNYRWGYCPLCGKNIPHYPLPNSALAPVLKLCTLGLAKRFRLGPWYCVHCETRSIYLNEERPDALRFRHADEESASQKSATDDASQSVGNYLKSEQSLVIKSSRLKRFSEKYRDSVVRRLLSGTSTMTQIRRERDISEGELTDWIADLFGRMQDRIDALENPANPSPYRLLENDETAAQAKSFPPGRTIDGQTKPK